MTTTISRWVGSIRQIFKGFSLRKWMVEFYTEQRQLLSEMRVKSKNLRKTNFELGLYHLKMGNLNDAILRFKTAVIFSNTAYLESNFFLGRCYQQKGDMKKARVYLNKYLTSNHIDYIPEARYCLALLDNKLAEIKQVPPLIVQIKFNQLAAIYDQLMFVNRASTPQQQLFTMIHHLLIANQKAYGNRVLDLGCGTGVMGRLANSYDIADYQVGVELAENMADIAKNFMAEEKLVYHRIYEGNIKKFFQEDTQETDKIFDVIFLSEVICYDIDIEYLAINCHKKIAATGFLGVSFKTYNGDKDYNFNIKLEDFSFNEKYITAIFEKHGWKIVKEADTTFQTTEEGKLLILTKVEV